MQGVIIQYLMIELIQFDSVLLGKVRPSVMKSGRNNIQTHTKESEIQDDLMCGFVGTGGITIPARHLEGACPGRIVAWRRHGEHVVKGRVVETVGLVHANFKVVADWAIAPRSVWESCRRIAEFIDGGEQKATVSAVFAVEDAMRDVMLRQICLMISLLKCITTRRAYLTPAQASTSSLA